MQPGDLVTIDTSIDRRGLYLELRNSNNKMIYSFPRVTVDPDDLMIVLEVDVKDVLVLTPNCKRGWITMDTLELVSPVSVVSAASE